MNQDEVKQNLLAPAQWLRILLMAGYALALWVLGMALVVIVITQALMALVTGAANPNLRGFGAMLAVYVGQIIAFLVYATEDKPFPFAPFPADAEAGSAADHASGAATAAAKGAGENPAPRSYPPQAVNPDAPPSDQHLHGVDDPADDWHGDSNRS